jgi:carboxyl-terminal processing protease
MRFLGCLLLSLGVLAACTGVSVQGVSAQESAEGSDEPSKEEQIKAQTPEDTYRQLNLFGDVFERVRSQYVEPMTDEL